MQEWSKETARLQEVTGIPWRNNNMRHAYGSYTMAILDDYAQVAALMGNSIEKVKSNYDGVATPAQAAEWFAIVPDAAAGKIVAMGTSA